MQNYYVVTVPQELLAQVTREVLSFTTDANRVEVVHGPDGQTLHVDPLVAEAWLEFRRLKEAADLAELQVTDETGAPAPEPAPEPVPEPEPQPEPTPPPAPVVEAPKPVAAPTVTPAPVQTPTAVTPASKPVTPAPKAAKSNGS